MKILSPNKQNRALTLIELLVIFAVLAILVALLLPAMKHSEIRALRISCDGYLKNIGIGFRVWETDHGTNYPMAVSQTNGGTAEFVTGLNAFRHYQVMSNELSLAKLLVCPADKSRIAALDFNSFNNSNLSYFVGTEASEINPQLILAGDRNITNGTAIKNGILELTPNQPAGWSEELHNGVGNMALADGSVQQLSIAGLRSASILTSLATNRLQMPVLGP